MQLPAIHDSSRASLADLNAHRSGRSHLAPGDSDRISFQKLFSLVRRQTRWLIWTATLIFILGAAVTLLMPRTYSSSAVVKLQGADDAVSARVKSKTENPDVAPMEGDADVATQIGVIQSSKLAARVLEDGKLMEDPAFVASLGLPDELKTPRGTVNVSKLGAEQAELLNTAAIATLIGYLDVERIGNSYTVAISYRSRDPALSQRVVDGFVREYIQAQVIDRKQASAKAATFLAGKVEELRQAASGDYAAVQNYRIRNGLLSTTGATLTEQDLSVYNQQVASARSDAAAATADLQTARQQLATGSHGDDVGQALSSPVISGLRSQRAEMAAKVAELAANFGPRYPDLIAARQNLAAIDEQIQAEINRVISNLEAKSNVAGERLSSLEGTISATKGTLVRNNQAMIMLDALQRRADASQALYQDYVTRYRDVLAQSGIEQPDAEVLVPANLPEVPESPRVPLYLVLTAFIALFVGVAVAIARELQFTGLTTGNDVETRVDLPFLGVVPDNRCVPKRDATALKTLISQPNSVMAEAIRGVLTATTIATPGRGSVLAISSALPDEGKTMLSAMLGLTAARQGLRVVVVDCDIVQRGLSRLCRLKDVPGLQQVAAEQVAIEAGVHAFGEGGPMILPITGRPAPGERLTMEGAIQKIVAQLKERFALIILDCPPLHVVAEARDIAALADGVVLATRWRRTSSENLRLAARMLPPRLSHFTGVVLTMVDLRKQRKYAPDSAAPYGEAYQAYMARIAQ